jgi:hypothetical protein
VFARAGSEWFHRTEIKLMMRPVSKGKVMSNRRHPRAGDLSEELQYKVTPKELLRLVSPVPLTSIMRRMQIDGPTRNG